MKQLKYVFWCLLLALTMSSCGERVKEEDKYVKVSPTSLKFDAKDQSIKYVTVSSNTSWTASVSDPSWISVSPSSGSGNASLSVKVLSENTSTTQERTGTISFSGGSWLSSFVPTVSVIQDKATAVAPEDPAVALVPNPVTFDGTKRSNTAYQLLIYTFADSDGDGVGDFKGIQNKLDYLDGLGVTALWLSPAHPTSSYHAYDVNDYYSLNPLYGTEEDFKNLLQAAHQKNIAIYMDYVLNHSGKNNAWFKEAVSDPTSPYRDFYFFSSNPSADYSKFPMLRGTTYKAGEWKQAVTGAPVITVTKTEEAAVTGNASWNLWFWKEGGEGKALQFVSQGDGTYYLVVEMSGKHGMLLRKDNSWDAKYGAGSGSITEGVPYEMQPNGGDLFFTGDGRYKITLSNVGGAETLYYMGCFSDWMPDLNYGDVSEAENNATFKALAASADKWINMGVDGLRLDAVKHICGGIDSYNNESNQTLLKKWYDHCNATYKAAGHSDNIFMVAEAWADHGVEKGYYKSLTSCFEFDYGYKVRDILNSGSAAGFADKVGQWVSDHTAVRSDAITSFFLSNHDQDRFASNVGRKEERLKQAAAILLSGPGKPFIYQGEELGYWGTKENGDENVRQPLAWNASLTDLAKKGLTLDGKDKTNYSIVKGEISVETQSAKEGSLLNVYKSWSKLRNSYDALATGKMSTAPCNGGAVAAWYMTSGSQKLLVIHNVATSAKTVEVSDSMAKPIAVLGKASTKDGKLILEANSSVMFEL